MSNSEDERNWTFLTSHAAVLLEVARDGEATVRELGQRARLTERQTHRVLAELREDGYVNQERIGRRARRSVDRSRNLPHPFAGHAVGELLDALP